MRAMLRTGPVLLAAALLVLAPTISPGGSQVINKGPFDIDPTEEEPNTPFDLAVHGEDCFDPDSLADEESTSSARPNADLLGLFFTNVHVQVVGPRPSDDVIASEDYEPETGDFDPGEWGSPPLIPFPEGLAAGTYLVTAECEHHEVENDAESDSASASAGEPVFILLGGDGEAARCTDESPVGTPGNLGPGCYEPQELVIEAGAAEAEEAEPTFTG